MVAKRGKMALDKMLVKCFFDLFYRLRNQMKLEKKIVLFFD